MGKLFHTGSWLFLMGSVVLIYACEFAPRLDHNQEATDQPAHGVLYVRTTEEGKSLKEVQEVRDLIKQKSDKDHEMARSSPQPHQLRTMLLAGMDHGGLPAFLV